MPFDPYHDWLGIPPDEQPPNHYRLLGLSLGQSDPSVIENAATRQMVHVQTFADGDHAERAERIQNEISAARICLLDPKKKQAYDAHLRVPKPVATSDNQGQAVNSE